MNTQTELTNQFVNRTNEQMFYRAGVQADPFLFGDEMCRHGHLNESDRRQKARLACIWKGYETLKGVEIE